MPAVPPTLIKELRDRTGAPLGECRKALVETDGDIEAAIESMFKRSGFRAEGKKDRIAGEGRIVTYLDPAGQYGVLLEVNCESDFVANTKDFQGMANLICEHIAKEAPADVAELLEHPFGSSSDHTMTFGKWLAEQITLTGEKIDIRRFVRFELGTVA